MADGEMHAEHFGGSHPHSHEHHHGGNPTNHPSEKLYAYSITLDGHGGDCYKVTGAFPIRPQIVVSQNGSPVLSGGEHFTIVGQKDVQTYIGTATDQLTGKIIGFIFEDATTGQYFLFSKSPYVWNGTPLESHPSTGPSDPHKTNWDLCAGQPVCHCFLAGTMVMTPKGEMVIESLKAGDLVTLSDGSAAPVIWLGVQTVSTRFADKLRSLPIRIAAGALGEGRPKRDLLISPDHALLLDGMLVQAGALVNDVTITRETIREEIFHYYHVEVAEHAFVLVEGVEAETFLDNVSRMAFDNWDEHDDAVHVQELKLPRVKSARQLPRGLRQMLLGRAAITSAEAA